MEKSTFGLGQIEIRTHEKLLIRIIFIHVAVHENSSHRHDIIMWLFSLENFHNLSQSATTSTFSWLLFHIKNHIDYCDVKAIHTASLDIIVMTSRELL